MAAPRVRLVVLNHDGGPTVLRCLEHLREVEWPADRLELVVVDNASTDGSPDAIAERFPGVTLVRRDRNDGFPANDVALEDLAGVDLVGLVNSDAFVTPGFVAPLVAALEADPGLGAACPKMLFDHRFVEVVVEAPAARPGRGDPRALGVRVAGLRVGGTDAWRHARLAEGGHGPEVTATGRHEWTGPRATLAVPVERPPHPGTAAPPVAEVLLSAVAPKRARLSSGPHVHEVEVGPEPRWVPIATAGPARDVVNNAGSVVLTDGHGADRGFGQPDDGRFDRPTDVFAWCGGAVLLRPAYLADVGLLAWRFFLYYEDTDLSWRGQARGWRYRYVPGSVVHHRHAATSVEGSARFAYYTERNRLLMLARNAPAPLALGALRRFATQTYDAARRDVAGALAQGRRPNAVPVRRRLRALAGFARLAPWAVATRVGLRARQTVPDWQLIEGLTPVASATPHEPA